MKLLLVALLVVGSFADLYLHFPRGSNNRLNGNGVNRGNDNRLFDSQNNAKGGYNVGEDQGAYYLYQGSKLQVEWTNQHGCGANPKTDCELLAQYYCSAALRDGNNENTPNENNDNQNTGLHEDQAYYAACKARERNKGLFTADQNLNGNDATKTRQNPNGGRSGLECPEERDYYPYWAQSPWRDAAILTNHPERCDYYKANSHNVKAWGDEAAHGIAAPDCLPAPWSRDNHLGNTLDGQASRYLWTIPNDANGECVFRMRYNISTGDYDAWNIDNSQNGDNSPIEQNPNVEFGIGRQVQLALNTNQFGRTFQDRSHTFQVKAPAGDAAACPNIYNLGVRGKRGNIVQTYPAVEYDFVPNVLEVNQGDCVHIQWTGSDNNPAGYAGTGTAGTDKSNMVMIANGNENFPIKQAPFGFFGNDAARVKTFALLGQNNNQLNNANAYFDGGIIKADNPGKYSYMSTRNNNFTNRSHKATIVVQSA